jgi:hypothetical protein
MPASLTRSHSSDAANHAAPTPKPVGSTRLCGARTAMRVTIAEISAQPANRVQSAGGADLVEPHEPRETCHVGGDMAAKLRPTRIGCSGSMAKLPQRRHRRPAVPAASLGLRPDVVNNGTIAFLRARFDRQLTVGPRLMRQ